jgi:hypothetical protein
MVHNVTNAMELKTGNNIWFNTIYICAINIKLSFILLMRQAIHSNISFLAAS